MLNNIIYSDYQTIESRITTSSLIPNQISIVNNIPDLMEGTVYMRDMMTLYQLQLKPNQTNIALNDILTTSIEGDLEEALSSIMESDRQKYISTDNTVLIKNYSIQGSYAKEEFMKDKTNSVSFSNLRENKLFVYNPRLITNNFFEFIVEFTRPKSNYDTLVLKLPTVVSRAMTEFVYLISTLFQSLMIYKFKNSFWFKDSFIIVAKKPYSRNITEIRNKIGMDVSSSSELKGKQTTFRLDKLDGKPFTSILEDKIPDSFLNEWNDFRRKVYNSVFRYHKTLKMSIDKNNIINPYQLFLKKLGTNEVVNILDDIEGGDRRNQFGSLIRFDAYIKKIHEKTYSRSTDDIKSVSYNFSDLRREKEYVEDDRKNIKNFSKQGQVKLYLVELKFFTRLNLKTPTPKLIIYLGAAPGIHILSIIEKFHNPSITWLFYDKSKFYSTLRDEENRTKYNIILVEDYFTKENIRQLSSHKSVYNNHDKYLISDIRFTEESEPTTEDLIRDYDLENEAVIALQPKAALLKWRYPFVNKNSNKDKVLFQRVIGSVNEEWLQPFSKPLSSELRLYLEGPKYDLKDVTVGDSLIADRLMYAYKSEDRYIARDIRSDEMLISSCRCNDCCIFNSIATELKKLNISLTIEDILNATD